VARVIDNKEKLTMQKFHYSSKFLLVSGFAFVIVIISALTVTWAIHVSESKDNIKVIFGEQKQSRLLVAMRDAARQRAIYLHRMAMLKDPFARDEEYMKFNSAATEFVLARDELLGMENEASAEVSIWNKARPHIQNGRTAQMETAELILQEREAEANNLLLEKVIPIQNKVNETLSEMFGVQRDLAQGAYEAAVDRNERIYWIAILSGTSAVLMTIIIAIIVIRRTVHAEASLDEARVAAQTATEMKSQFLANMSHEIRTPLTAVIGYADTLLERDITENDREHSATRILNNGRHLLHIINDILDISKIEAGQLSVEMLPVSQVQLMMDVDSLIGSPIRDKGLVFNIKYQFPIPEKIDTDPTRLKQILLNLLGNAEKFTEQGSITLGVKYLPETNQMRYEVTDSGVGMSQEEQSRLFKPFSQADESTTRKFGGTGLGLYISRQLAQMLGGELVCQSAKGQGSKFVATIAANVQQDASFIESLDVLPARQNTRERDAAPSLSGVVLLAEDNPDNQRLISMYIRNTGADAVVVSNGQEAVEQAIANHFNLIMMDMQMPVMGGAEAVRWLREIGNQTPIAMLTANAMKEEKDRCIRLGANDFLTKPVDKQSFYSVLGKYLQQGILEESGRVQENTDDMFVKLVDDFVNALPGHANRLQVALDNGDWQSIRSVIHLLKGMGSSFGFPTITITCGAIERLLKNDSMGQAVESILQLLECVDQVVMDHNTSFGNKKLGT